jgi:hypothetical protein
LVFEKLGSTIPQEVAPVRISSEVIVSRLILWLKTSLIGLIWGGAREILAPVRPRRLPALSFAAHVVGPAFSDLPILTV